MSNGELKNKFRNELKKENKTIVQLEAEVVGEPEMLRRDQYVTMRQLQVLKEMQGRDAVYTQAVIEVYETFLEELGGMPLSQAREGISLMVGKQIEQLQKQKAASRFPRPNEVTLTALEAVFAETEVDREEPKELPDD